MSVRPCTTRAAARAAALTLSAAALALPGAASAQATDGLDACAAIANDAERLACFDAVLRVRASQPAKELSAPATVSRPTVTRPLTNSAIAAPAPAVATPARQKPGLLGRMGRVVGIGDKAPDTVENFGRVFEEEREAEAVAMVQDDEVSLPVARVTTFDTVKRRFYMGNGQVWEQTTTTDARIDEGRPPAGTYATIERSGFGGFKMSLNGKKRRFKVKRVR